MIPQLTPTYLFSAFCPSNARRMDGNVQPPSVCQAIAYAISTAADELKPEPRGTSDAKTAFIEETARFSSINDHITPAGYNAHSGSGDESAWVFVEMDSAEKDACWLKSAATSVE